MRKRAAILSILILAIGCHRDDVQSVRIDKTEAVSAPSLPTPAPPPAEKALRWALPQGWKAEPATGMRYATLKPSVPGNLEVSVITLTGSAGGELMNVNRWRSQLGLEPIDEKALASIRKVVQSKAGPVSVFEFTGGGNRMVVGLLSTPEGDSWFLKLMGDDAPVGMAKGDFMKLLGTLSLG